MYGKLYQILFYMIPNIFHLSVPAFLFLYLGNYLTVTNY